MSVLTIEKLGGIAGFGGPHLKSDGQYAFNDLKPVDQTTVTRLFQGGSIPPRPGFGDTFQYRISRNVNGQRESIEVPEDVVPAALLACAKDRLE